MNRGSKFVTPSSRFNKPPEQKSAQSHTRSKEMRNDLAKQLESMTLDKLVAEDRANTLQAELEKQKDRISTLESELALLKTARNTSILDSSNNRLEDVTLETAVELEYSDDASIQIENYKAALIKMRDIVTTANYERAEMQQQYEQCQADYLHVQAENDKLMNEFSQVCDEVIGLHQQLDAARGSAQMVEFLTEKTFDLENKLRAIIEDKNHLEEMVQLSEEIAESARESQLELRKECEEYAARLVEKCNEVVQLETQSAQYDVITQEFRQKILNLNKEIVSHKDKIQILEDQLKELESGSANTVQPPCSCADKVAIELEKKQLESDVEDLKWKITKKDEQISNLAKALKDLEDTVSFLKVQVEREKNKNSKLGQTNDGAATQNAEQIQEALQKERLKHTEEMETLQRKITELGKKLEEKNLTVKRIVKKAPPTIEKPSIVADRTTISANLKSSTSHAQISGFPQTPNEILQSLNWAHERICRLQAELDGRHLLELKSLSIQNNNVFGAESFRFHNNVSSSTPDQIATQHDILLDESNLLLLESKKLSNIQDRTTDSYKRQLVDYNKRAIDLRLRTYAFASRNYPHMPMPTESKESVNVKSQIKAKPAEFQSLINEKIGQLQKSASCRKELISSMLKDLKNRRIA